MDKLRSKLLVLAVALIAVFAAVTLLRTGRSQNPLPSSASAVSEATPSPSLATTLESPDGKVALTMRQEKAEGGRRWAFSVGGREIFSKVLPLGASFSIPLNTFSPDDKYIFLEEITPEKVSYPVLAISGEPLTKNAQTLEIVGLFAEKYPEYKVTDVTGWGGVGLIIVNTDKVEGGVGPSFWFEVASASFIRLSNRFN
jgi:hypothetical protein